MNFGNLRVKDVRAVLHYEPNLTRWSTNNRKFHIIGVQLSGSAYHNLKYKDFVLSGNCVYFFNQKDDYDVEVLKKGEAFSIHFTTYEDIDEESFCLQLRDVTEFTSLLNKAELMQRTEQETDLALLSLVYKFCAEVIAAKSKGVGDKRMLLAKNYIDTHFHKAACLQNAIAGSGLTSRRFNDLYKSNFNTTPNRYLTLKKLSYAKELLEAGSFSVSQTADLCGFSDVYYFSKVFKKEYGVCPSKWK